MCTHILIATEKKRNIRSKVHNRNPMTMLAHFLIFFCHQQLFKVVAYMVYCNDHLFRIISTFNYIIENHALIVRHATNQPPFIIDN